IDRLGGGAAAREDPPAGGGGGAHRRVRAGEGGGPQRRHGAAPEPSLRPQANAASQESIHQPQIKTPSNCRRWVRLPPWELKALRKLALEVLCGRALDKL